MAVGLIAKKAGMTQVFAESGEAVPVTVLKIEPCRVVSLRTRDHDGYDAVQVGYGMPRRSNSRALQGHYARLGQDVMFGLREFRLGTEESFTVGQELSVGMFEAGQKVDITGTSKGRGFAGVIKRWNFAGGKASHGAEKVHRSAGSTGQCQDPSRVWKGKKMAGHYGSARKTTQNLVIVRVDADGNRLLVRGAVPGPKNGLVEIRPAVKGS